MRKTITIVFLVAGCFLAVLMARSIRELRRTQFRSISVSERDSRIAEAAKQRSGITSEASITNQMSARTPGLPPLPTNHAGLQAWQNKVHRPIVFYGKVLDERGTPVPRAIVSLSVNKFLPPEGTFGTNVITDQDGFFDLSGVSGSTLSVRIEKQGYYPCRPTKVFDYMALPGSQPFEPDRSHPVEFVIRHKGQGNDLITSSHGVWREVEISGVTNGVPVHFDFFKKSIGAGGQLQLSANKPSSRSGSADWSFQMYIPDGGFIEENDEFPFEAPASGYQPLVRFDFKAGENWTNQLQKRYYVVFGQPPKYGRVEVQTGPYRGVSLQYAINPTGARTLEPRED